MNYPRSEKYDTPLVNGRIMGPNPLKLQEELLAHCRIARGATVLDLGSGQGVTSAFLAKEYGFRVFAVDLWSDPGDNLRFFEAMGLDSRQVIPIKADATALPFATGFFDAVVSTDSYNYFGRDPAYLEEKLLPFVRPGGMIYIAVPGMVRDCHDNLPPELLLSWTPEQMDYMHDAAWWRAMVSRAKGARVISVREMESNAEAWADWLRMDNEYAVGDRKSMEAGAGKYLNFIAMEICRE